MGRQQRSKCQNQGELEGLKGHGGIKRVRRRVGGVQEEEMRRSSRGAEGRASQVSTFLSIFHQAGQIRPGLSLFLCVSICSHILDTSLLSLQTQSMGQCCSKYSSQHPAFSVPLIYQLVGTVHHTVTQGSIMFSLCSSPTLFQPLLSSLFSPCSLVVRASLSSRLLFHLVTC